MSKLDENKYANKVDVELGEVVQHQELDASDDSNLPTTLRTTSGAEIFVGERPPHSILTFHKGNFCYKDLDEVDTLGWATCTAAEDEGSGS